MSRAAKKLRRSAAAEEEEATHDGDDTPPLPSINFERNLRVRLIAMHVHDAGLSQQKRDAKSETARQNYPDYAMCNAMDPATGTPHTCIVEAHPLLDEIAGGGAVDPKTGVPITRYHGVCGVCPADGTPAFNWTAPRASGPADVHAVRDAWLDARKRHLAVVRKAGKADTAAAARSAASAHRERAAFHAWQLLIHDVVAVHVRDSCASERRGPSHDAYQELIDLYEEDAKTRRANQTPTHAWCHVHRRPGHALAQLGVHAYKRECGMCRSKDDEETMPSTRAPEPIGAYVGADAFNAHFMHSQAYQTLAPDPPTPPPQSQQQRGAYESEDDGYDDEHKTASGDDEAMDEE
jgi:hypothetical protein